MPHEIRVYRDNAASSIVFRGSSVLSQFTNQMHAIETDEGLIDIFDVYANNFRVVAGVAYTVFKKQDGTAAGVDVGTTVDYLNSQFQAFAGGGPSGDPPVITSVLTSTVVSSTPFLYQITADNNPTYFDASNLPSGLAINQATGLIFGLTSNVGVHNISITAFNPYGVDSQTLQLTVLAGGGFVDTYSVRFQNSVYKQYVEMTGVSSSLQRGSDLAWSVAFWLYVEVLGESDIWSYGTTETNYCYIGLTSDNKIRVRLKQSNTKKLEISAGSVSVGTWYCIVVANSGSGTLDVYQNNVLQANTVVENTLDGVAGSGTTVRIGRVSGAATSALYLNGLINEWAYYDKRLNAGEVNAIWNGGTPTDLSALGSSGNLKSWLRMGDGDTYPTLSDATGGNDGSMKNMTTLNIINLAP